MPLQGTQPEEPDSALLPLTDGRVLILRRVADRFAVSLLYPAGPGTGELLLGAVPAPALTLLPPAPGGTLGYALAPEARTTTLWLLHGGADGPERVIRIPGRCTGGVWLDRSGRLLALDRELDGRTKTVVVDLERGGETGLLLQITDESNDRLLLADPDSGLLLVRSDAPGHDRLGWGVLGSSRPVRFPECLRPAEGTLTPFAMQPGQMLAPESCAVAFRREAANGTWLGVWRPSERQLRHFPAPEGWLAGAGLWTVEAANCCCRTRRRPSRAGWRGWLYRWGRLSLLRRCGRCGRRTCPYGCRTCRCRGRLPGRLPGAAGGLSWMQVMLTTAPQHLHNHSPWARNRGTFPRISECAGQYPCNRRLRRPGRPGEA